MAMRSLKSRPLWVWMPFRSTPGKWSWIGESRASRFSSMSCITIVAVNIFAMLATK